MIQMNFTKYALLKSYMNNEPATNIHSMEITQQ